MNDLRRRAVEVDRHPRIEGFVDGNRCGRALDRRESIGVSTIERRAQLGEQIFDLSMGIPCLLNKESARPRLHLA